MRWETQDWDLNKRKETEGAEHRQRGHGQAAFGVLGTQHPSFKVLT